MFKIKKSTIYFETWQIWIKSGVLYKAGLYFDSKKEAKDYLVKEVI